MEKEFIELVKKNEQIVLKVCNVYCHESGDREDLYQEILIQLWKAFPTFNRQAKFSTWMYRISFNTAVSRYRKAQKSPQSEPIPDQLADTSVDQNENAQMLHQAIASLNAIEKAIIMLYMDELKYREIGEIVGISESNVGFKINRIKEKLKKQLKTQAL